MAATASNVIAFDLRANVVQLATDMNKASRTVEDGVGKIRRLAAGLSTAFAGVGAAFMVQDMIAQAIQGEQAMVQLQAVVKSTGGAAGMTADEIKKLSENMSVLTGIDDENIMQMNSLLLTFTRIGRDVLPQASMAVMNMSQAMGQDLKSSAIQIGKALNDPITGLTALQRVGVSVDAAMKEQIKTWVAHGEIVMAQKAILAELNKEFGGSAEAARNTLGGALAALKVNYENLLQAIGENSTSGLRQGVEGLNEALKWLIDHGDEVTHILQGLVAGATTLVGLRLAAYVRSITLATGGLIATLTANPWGLIAAGIALAVGALVDLRDQAITVGKTHTSIAQSVGAAWKHAGEVVASVQHAIGAAVTLNVVEMQKALAEAQAALEAIGRDAELVNKAAAPSGGASRKFVQEQLGMAAGKTKKIKEDAGPDLSFLGKPFLSPAYKKAIESQEIVTALNRENEERRKGLELGEQARQVQEVYNKIVEKSGQAWADFRRSGIEAAVAEEFRLAQVEKDRAKAKQDADEIEQQASDNRRAAMQAGYELTTQVMTQEERHQQALGNINQLFIQGAISAQTHARAIAQCNAEYKKLNETGQQVAQILVNGFENAIFSGQKLGDIFKSLARDLAQLALKVTLLTPLQALLGGIFSGNTMTGAGSAAGGNWMAAGLKALHVPGFARGGRPATGSAFLVGEEGPELVQLDRPGTVYPNGARLGGVAVNVQIINNTSAAVSSEERPRADGGKDLIFTIEEKMAESVRRGGALGRAIKDQYGLARSTPLR